LHPHFVTYGFLGKSCKEWEIKGKIKNKLQLHNSVPTPTNWPWTKDPKTHEAGPFVGTSSSKVFPYQTQGRIFTHINAWGQVLWQVFTHQDPLDWAPRLKTRPKATTLVTALYLLGTRWGTIVPKKQLMQQTSNPSTSLQLMQNSNYLIIFKFMFLSQGLQRKVFLACPSYNAFA
jgi:hypothetical protein